MELIKYSVGAAIVLAKQIQYFNENYERINSLAQLPATCIKLGYLIDFPGQSSKVQLFQKLIEF